MSQAKTFSGIGAPHGHTSFTLVGAKSRCSCGQLCGDRPQYAAHIQLELMLAKPGVAS